MSPVLRVTLTACGSLHKLEIAPGSWVQIDRELGVLYLQADDLHVRVEGGNLTVAASYEINAPSLFKMPTKVGEPWVT